MGVVAPVTDRRDARGNESHAVEEPGERRAVAWCTGVSGLVVFLRVEGLDLRFHLGGQKIQGDIRDGQVTSGGERVGQGCDQAVGVVGVWDEVQNGDEQKCDRLVEVEGGAQVGVIEDGLGVAQIGVDVGGGAAGRGAQQSAGVGTDDRVVACRVVCTM